MDDRSFMPIGPVKRIIKSFKRFYDIKQIDYTGGEPTLYKDLNPLLKWTKDQGIDPTVITHGLYMDKVTEPCEFLISVHDVGERANKIAGRKDFFKLQSEQIKKVSNYRTNTTVYKDNYEHLEELAKYLVTTKTKVHNFIMFNPFISKSNFDKIFIEFTKVRPHIERAIDILEGKGIKVNVRYVPFCMLPNNHRNIVDWHQLQFDKDEWVNLAWHQKPSDMYFDPYQWYQAKEADYAVLQLGAVKRRVTYSDITEAPFIEWGHRQTQNLKYFKNEKCEGCGLNDVCDGFAGNYIAHFGTKEIDPIYINPPVVDVNTFRDDYENTCCNTKQSAIYTD